MGVKPTMRCWLAFSGASGGLCSGAPVRATTAGHPPRGTSGRCVVPGPDAGGWTRHRRRRTLPVPPDEGTARCVMPRSTPTTTSPRTGARRARWTSQVNEHNQRPASRRRGRGQDAGTALLDAACQFPGGLMGLDPAQPGQRDVVAVGFYPNSAGGQPHRGRDASAGGEPGEPGLAARALARLASHRNSSTREPRREGRC
jgi:hypothetical protein